MSKHHCITFILLKSLHWLKSLANSLIIILQSPVAKLQFTPYNTSRPNTFANSSQSSSSLRSVILLPQSFSTPRSPFISNSPTKPYPTQLWNHVFGTIYNCLNSTLSQFLYHHHCQSPIIICLRLLYSSPPHGLSTFKNS